jgi:hypothetical protein
MLTTLWSVVLATTVSATHTDTSFAVPQGSRLSVHNFSGAIVVVPWGKSSVRIEANHPDIGKILVDREGTSFDVRVASRRRIPVHTDYRISAPPWMSLELEGVHCDLSVEGWKSDVQAETVDGGVSLTGGEGLIRLSSITGLVKVSGARGRLQLSSVEEGVDVSDAEGEITVEAVNGDVLLDRVRSKLVEAATVGGDVRFTGWISNEGRYRFSSHSGDLDVTLPEEADATVSVSTFNGDFESTFPVRVNDARAGRSFSFTLGTGKAVVTLETFGGTINLHRSDATAKHEGKDKGEK